MDLVSLGRSARVGVALLALACSDATGPRVDPHLRPILFIGRGTLGPVMFSVRGDGSDLHRVTTATQEELYPSWSRDGTRIAFTRGQSIFVMNTNGQNGHPASTQLPDCPYIYYTPSWSPDGTQLAVECYGELSVVSLTNGQAESLSSQYSIGGSSPDWSPDGTTLLVSGSSRADVPVTTPNGPLVVHFFGLGGAAAWSPDAHQIAYEGTYGTRTAIFVAAADGSASRRITSPSVLDADDQADEAPTWSGDAKWIAFHRRSLLCTVPQPPTGRDCRSHWTIYAVRVDGTGLRRLTPDSLDATQPDWY